MTACLDSWAVLEWLDGLEPAASRVEELLTDRPLMSWINAAEVYYRVERDHDRAEADWMIERLRSLLRLEAPSPQRAVEAARVKAVHAISLADCFAAATAAANAVPLLTGDPELIDASDLPCEVEDLRP